MFSFFDFLRSMNLNVLLITERNLGSHAELQGNEGFLADAVINMGMDTEMVNLFEPCKLRRCVTFDMLWKTSCRRWHMVWLCLVGIRLNPRQDRLHPNLPLIQNE